MQDFFRKILILFVTTCSCGSLMGQPAAEYLLNRGDSLFRAGKYTEALPVYRKLLSGYGKSSPQMLLKMAFLSEAQGDLAGTLYALNLYYNQSPDRRVFEKMAELAQKNKLSGYEYSDQEYLTGLMLNFKWHALTVGYLICLVLFIVLIRNKLTQRDLSAPLTGVIVVGVILLALLNLTLRGEQGIIRTGSAYLMESPSAGAKMLDQVGQGHRVMIVDESDIWTEVRWEDKTAWIRSGNLLIVKR